MHETPANLPGFRCKSKTQQVPCISEDQKQEHSWSIAMGWSVEHLEHIHANLRSDKVTARKEATKRLRVALEDSEFLETIDRRTCKLIALENVTDPFTWPALVHTMCICVEEELKLTRYKGKSSLSAAKFLCEIVAMAESGSSQSNQSHLMLWKKAKFLYRHVAHVMAIPNVDRPTFVEYCTLLARYLLPTQPYSKAAPQASLLSILRCIYQACKKLLDEWSGQDGTPIEQELFRMLDALASVLKYSNVDDSLKQDEGVSLVDKIVMVLCKILSDFNDQGRIAVKAVEALNEVLVKDGYDSFHVLDAIDDAVESALNEIHETTQKCLRAEFRAELCRFFFIQLKLRGCIFARATYIWSCLVRELSDETFTTASSYLQQNDSWLIQASAAAAVMSDLQWTGHPTTTRDKKTCIRRPLQELKHNTLASPAVWGPIMCVAIQQHAMYIQEETLFDMLKSVCRALDRCLKGNWDISVLDPASWFLRWAQELAFAWKMYVVVPKTGAGWTKSSLCSLRNFRELEEASECWKQIFQACIDHLLHHNKSMALAQECLLLMAACMSCSLLDNFSIQSSFWALKYFGPPVDNCQTELPLAAFVCIHVALEGSFVSLASETDENVELIFLKLLMEILEFSSSQGSKQDIPSFLPHAVSCIGSFLEIEGFADTHLHAWKSLFERWRDNFSSGPGKPLMHLGKRDDFLLWDKGLAAVGKSQKTNQQLLQGKRWQNFMLQFEFFFRNRMQINPHGDSSLTASFALLSVAVLLLVRKANISEGSCPAGGFFGSNGHFLNHLIALVTKLNITSLGSTDETCALIEQCFFIVGREIDGQLLEIQDSILKCIACKARDGLRAMIETKICDFESSSIPVRLDHGNTDNWIMGDIYAKDKTIPREQYSAELAHSVCALLRFCFALHKHPDFELGRCLLQSISFLLDISEVASVQTFYFVERVLSVILPEFCKAILTHTVELGNEAIDIVGRFLDLRKSEVSILAVIQCLNEVIPHQQVLELESPQMACTLRLVEEIRSAKRLCFSNSCSLRVESLKLFANLLSIHGKNFAHLAEELALSLGDASYHVRCHAIQSCMVLFRVFTDIQGVFRRLLKHLPGQHTSRNQLNSAEMETNMLFLFQVSRACPELEETFVHMVAIRGVQSSQLCSRLIPHIFGAAAKESNYPTICSYLGHHMPLLVYHWLKSGLALRSLKLLNDKKVSSENDQKVFQQHAMNGPVFPLKCIKEHAGTILPILLELSCSSSKEEKEKYRRDLEFMAEECHLSMDQLLLQFLPDTIGYLLLDVTRDLSSVIVESQLSNYLSSNVVEDNLSERMHELVSSMMLWAGPTNTEKPFYPKDSIKFGLDRIGKMCALFGNSRTENLLSPPIVRKILLRIHSCIHKCRNSRHTRRFLYSIDALVDVLGSATAVPSTFIYLTQLLVRALQWPGAQELCCQNLHIVIGNQLLDRATAICLEDVIGSILSALFSALKDSKTPSQRQHLVSLAHKLTLELPKHCLYMLSSLEPPPDVCGLEEISRFYHSSKGPQTAVDELYHLALRPLTLKTSLQESTMESVGRRALKALEPEKKEARESRGSTDKCKDMETAAFAAWRLLKKNNIINSNAMGDLVARIFMKLGPSFIISNGKDLGVVNQASLALEEADRILSSDRKDIAHLLPKGDKERARLVTALLLILYRLLYDSDPSIVKQSMNCLKALMALKEGKTTAESLPDKFKMTLVHFASSSVDESDVLLWAEKDTATAPDVTNDNIWDPSCTSYEEYLCSLVRCFLSHTDDLLLVSCSRICQISAAVAELLLPYSLASLALRDGSDGPMQKAISRRVSQYIFESGAAPLQVKRLWLSALHHLRIVHQRGMESVSSCAFSKKWEKMYWLELEYLTTADIALQCNAPFTAFLYTEQWCEKMGISLGSTSSNYEALGNTVKIRDILYRSLESIGDTDSVRALDQIGSMDSQARLFQHEGQWSKALQIYDLMLDNDSTAQQVHKSNALKSLKEIGCLHILKSNFVGANGLTSSALVRELQHEAAWRSCEWEKISPEAPSGTTAPCLGTKSDSFHGHLRLSMEALHSFNFDIFEKNIRAAQSLVLQDMVTNSFEGLSGLAEQIVQLQMLGDLHAASAARWWQCSDRHSRVMMGSSSNSTGIISGETPFVLEHMFSSWKTKKPELISLYSAYEPRLALQTSIYRVFDCKAVLRQHLRLVTSIARKAGRLHDATSGMFHLARMNNEVELGEVDLTSKWNSGLALCKVEEAKLLWANGYQQMATNVLRSLFSPNVLDRSMEHLDTKNQILYAKAVCLAGKWLAKTSGENTQTILQQYLAAPADALKLLESNVGPNCCRALFRLAQYADFLYKDLQTQLRSDEWKSSEAVRRQKNAELARLRERESEIELSFASGKAKQNALRDIARHLIPLQRQCDLDEGQAKRVVRDRNRYRNIAMTAYRQCLAAGNKYDLQGVFRLCSLWLSNPGETGVNQAMSTAFDRVPTFKWLPLVYQIASRTSTLNGDSELHQSGFHQVQHHGLQLIANDHPYHTLLQLFALKNGAQGKTNESKDQGRGNRPHNAITRTVDRDKILGAQEILESFRSMSSRNNEILRQMEILIDGYILLSNIPVRKKESGGYAPIAMPREVRSMQGLDHVPVLTAPLLARPDANYEFGSFPSFQCFLEKISIANGVTAPKLLQCQGSDGCTYRQLLKAGTDDLRQDATMQQLFGLVNSLLGNCPTAASRKLRVAVYKVIPFSPVCGLLEWVDNTVTLGDYLVGAGRRGGAHVRYHPKDITYAQCHQMLKNVSREEELRKTYDKVCSMFKPVLRHFFLEMFHQPPDWYKHRLAYTRSVAVNSIVGYVVGLGDRHSFNILIDKKSAEVIHIDLGIAFEQGRLLKTPELVPFRLTRDIVDGMGIFGVEGPMRKSCEETMEVMRRNQESLLTIIEVFLHDPLYQWALTVEAAMQHQWDSEGTSGEVVSTMLDDSWGSNRGNPLEVKPVNAGAERALLRVKQKLDGTEDGASRSVAGQVQKLIQEARDPDKLCRMYVGWSAFL